MDLLNDLIGAAIRQFEVDGFKDGDLVTHEWLRYALDIREDEPESLADLKRLQFLVLSRVEDFKDRLLSERQIALESVRGKGYRVVPPKEQAAFAVGTTTGLIEKAVRVGGKILRHTRVSVLTAEERRQHDNVSAKMDSFRTMVSRERKSLLA